MTLGDIITQSSNVGTIQVAARLGPDLLASYLSKFGYGQPSGLGFPGESEGILRPEYDWSGTSMATIPIGQGVSVTPVQMIDVYATIANGGVWVQPRLVRGTIDPNGVFQPAPASPTRRVVSAETATTVTGMLAHVVTSGTGVNAQIPGYWVAGKTGTAQIPKATGGYYNGRYVASFIGFLPAMNPQIAIAVIIDQPSTVYGGIASAPVFQQLGKEAIARLHIAAAEKPQFPPSAMGHK
jgi:cell division protein FtsI (penicillin-binding protein 3)